MMSFGQLALELVQGAAIGATRLAAIFERNAHPGVCIPYTHIRHRAGQRQIVRGDLDVTLGDVVAAHRGSFYT